jgi:FkbM family methyltransferase
MTFVDVGANIGEVTLLAAKRVGPTGRVIAFEPIPEIAKCLSNNVAANGFEQVSVMQLGLCDREGQAEVYRSDAIIKDGSVNDGLGSLYVGNRDRKAAGSIEVSTLDAQVDALGLTRVDVVKMDVEDAELPALRGAERVIRKHRPMLIVEVQEETARAAGYETADLFEFLERHGYRCETILNDGVTKPLDSSRLESFQNVLCLPSKEASL